MKIKRAFLVVRADGAMRIVTRTPKLRDDEVSVQLNIKYPEGWGRQVSTIDVELPGPPTAEVTPS